MAISFRDKDNQVVLTLPIGLRLASEDISYAGEGQVISGRPGRLWRPGDSKREPIIVSVQGRVLADTAGELNNMLRSWTAALEGQEWYLAPDDTTTKRLKVRYSRLNRSNVEGAGGTVAQVQLECVASDPFWVAGDAEVYRFDATSSGETAVLTNMGSKDVAPLITIYGTTVGGVSVVAPKLVNRTTGDILELIVSLSEGQAARIYPIYDRVEAYRGVSAITFLGFVETYQGWEADLESPTNVIGSINEQWLIRGFFLAPGENVIEFQDTEVSSHKASIVFEWRPAWY